MAKYEGQTNGNDKSGYGNMHGKIASPQGPCGYEVQPGGGPSEKGGETQGPFASYKESPSAMPIVGRDGLKANIQAGGSIVTPMDTSKSEMPGVRGSDGTGSVSGGKAKISTPWSGPWGDMVG